jgi:cysteine desulfurase
VVTSAYLDHAASTPMRPRALATLLDVAGSLPANPSGQHRWAHAARRRLDDARDVIAEVVGSTPGEVVFASGGTEADNLAVLGVARATGGRPACLATDHHGVLAPVQVADGAVLDVGGRAVVDPEQVASQLAGLDDVALVSFALVNNELGVVQPVDALVEAIRRSAPGARIHVDAVAAAAWMDLRPVVAAVDLVTLSAHKVGGPKGIGALVVRSGTPLAPTVHGGAQERERRAGTPDVAGAAAFAVALEECAAARGEQVPAIRHQADRLRAALVDAGGGQIVDTVATVAPGAEVVANVVHLCARDVHREPLLVRLDLDGVGAAAGSSCASGVPERSHVVEALGLGPSLHDGALRLSLGWCTSAEEIDHAIAVVPAAVRSLVGTAGAVR